MSEPQRPPFKILLCTIAYREKLLDDALEAAHQIGFEGIEVWGREPHISERYDENRVRAARKMIQAKNLSVPVLGSYLRLGATAASSDDTVELTDTLHTARQLKVQYVRVWASDVASAKASAETWHKTATEARHACDCAAKLGLTLIVEMHDATLADTARSALRLVEEVGRDNLRLNFQVAAWENGEDQMERLQKVLPFVSHVHAQNYRSLASRADTPVVRAPLRDGVFSYAKLLGRLREAGYNEHVGIEFAYKDGQGKRDALADDLAYLRSL